VTPFDQALEAKRKASVDCGVNAFPYRCESALRRMLDVLVGQLVELRNAMNDAEEYVPPPPGTFAGQGKPLGLSASQPTPGSSTVPPQQLLPRLLAPPPSRLIWTSQPRAFRSGLRMERGTRGLSMFDSVL